jgi:hypothetical protein
VRGKRQSNTGNKVRLQEITVARISRRSHSYMKLELVKLELVKLKLVEDRAGSSFRSVKLAEARWGNKPRIDD